jgi:hypothetical protein
MAAFVVGNTGFERQVMVTRANFVALAAGILTLPIRASKYVRDMRIWITYEVDLSPD